jgi:hypothetical protein
VVGIGVQVVELVRLELQRPTQAALGLFDPVVNL